MIQDTSGQDTLLAPARASRRKPLLLAAGGVVAVVAIVAIVVMLSGWLGSSKSVDVSRLRIAEVTRGTLVRDA
jgi:HlyD family secretion protein